MTNLANLFGRLSQELPVVQDGAQAHGIGEHRLPPQALPVAEGPRGEPRMSARYIRQSRNL